MTAAARSSSSAPSRSEQRTRSTSHRPGAICASEVTRGAGDEGASGGGVGGGAISCCDCCCEAGDCAHAASQQANRTATSLVFIIVPLSNHVALWLWIPQLRTPDEPVAVLRQADYRLNNMRPHCAPNPGVLHRGGRRSRPQLQRPAR